MTDTLADVLNSRKASAATLQHAVRYLVSEWSDDLPPDEVPDLLTKAGVPRADVDRIAADLSENADLLDSAVLAVLSYGWAVEPDAATGAVDEAGEKLPVVEVTVIVMAVMYGLHLLATRGRKSHTKTVRRTPDGGFEITETTEWVDPAAPLRAVASALTGNGEAGPPAVGGSSNDEESGADANG